VIGYYSVPGTAGYTTWRNFTIDEAFATHAPDTANAVVWTSPGNVIEQVTFNGVGETNTAPPQCNHSAIRVEGTGTVGTVLRNNTIYNYKSDGCGEWNINGAGILLYFADGTIIENNTIQLAGTGIYMKGSDHINTTIRKNLIYDTQIAIAYQYTGASGNNYITQNIIRCTGTPAPEKYGIWVRNDTENIWIVNNTIVGCESAGIGYGKAFTTEPSGTYVYNNIVSQSAGNSWGSDSGASLAPVTADYNLYYSATRFAVNGTQTSLADWRTALGGCPNAGNDCSAISSDPLFVNAGTYNYRLQVGSPALTLGVDVLDLDGDSSTVDTIPAGAYITGSETIGAGASLLAAPGRPRWRPLGGWWLLWRHDYALF
jgi:parallel beta-helix repeat protein